MVLSFFFIWIKNLVWSRHQPAPCSLCDFQLLFYVGQVFHSFLAVTGFFWQVLFLILQTTQMPRAIRSPQCPLVHHITPYEQRGQWTGWVFAGVRGVKWWTCESGNTVGERPGWNDEPVRVVILWKKGQGEMMNLLVITVLILWKKCQNKMMNLLE